MQGLSNEPPGENAGKKLRPAVSVLLLPLIVCAAIALIALAVPKILGRSGLWIFLPGFLTESTLLLCSLILSAGLTRGRIAAFGFTRGSFRLRAGFFLWIVPMSAVATLQVIGSPGGASTGAPGTLGSPVAVILSIWIYASLCEEIFTRGLLQSWLSPLAQHRIRLGKWALSAPVIASAIFFASMHLVLWPKLGPVTVVVMLLAALLGLVAGYYREKTGSLLPAVLIHSFFDIGGTLPFWIAAWAHQGHL